MGPKAKLHSTKQHKRTKARYDSDTELMNESLEDRTRRNRINNAILKTQMLSYNNLVITKI